MSYLSHVPQHELRQRAGKTVDSPDDRHRDVMSLFPQMTEQERSDTQPHPGDAGPAGADRRIRGRATRFVPGGVERRREAARWWHSSRRGHG